MKANVHTAKKQAGSAKSGGPFHGHELRLTIGMIVKDEEKNLDKCLSSLKPLLEAVPSELIITDTGSTDRTVEIAQKYTDHIIHFEWCGDFSAARNTGLNAARGEWFLFLDADEWFGDVTELVNFFNSGECDRYGSASYCQRNYLSFDGKTFNDYHAYRVFKILPEICFRNKVHEDVITLTPTKILDTFVHHYGYLYPTREAADKKCKRNTELLEQELKENPDDVKALEQLCNQIMSDEPEKAAEYAERGLEIVKKIPPEKTIHQCTRFALSLLRIDLNTGRNSELLKKLPEALSFEKERGVFHLEFYRMGQLAAFRLKRYESALKYGELYLELYPDYESGRLNRQTLMFAAFYYLTPEVRQEVLAANGEALCKLERPLEARACLEHLDLSKKISFRNTVFPLCFDVADKLGGWEIAAQLYCKIAEEDDTEKLQEFTAYVNDYVFQYPSRCHDIADAFAGLDRTGDELVLLSKLWLAEEDHNREKASDALEGMRKLENHWDVVCAEALWYILKEKINLVSFLPCLNLNYINPMAISLQKQHPDYAEVLLSYFDAFSFENTKVLCLAGELFEAALLDRQEQEKVEQYRRLFSIYAECQKNFADAVFRPQVLKETGFSVLRDGCRFGCYAGLALDAKREGDGAGYLKNLRLGLKEYPAMRDCVDFLLKDFEAEKEENDKRSAEFSALAKQVKRNIEQLIAQGDLKQAGDYTLQLAKLIPDDDDVRRYRRLTHTEPSVSELAARLPQ